jgi:hypothetical protein
MACRRPQEREVHDSPLEAPREDREAQAMHAEMREVGQQGRPRNSHPHVCPLMNHVIDTSA